MRVSIRSIAVAPMFALLSLVAAGPLSTGAAADPVAEFYKGKTVDMYVGFTVGGGYDLYARLVARHIGRYIPGSPTVVVKNMTGAGSVRLANFLYASAPKDGTVIGAFARGVPFDPLLGNPGPQFEDGSKFSFVGSANAESSVCAAWKGTGFKTFDDMKSREIVTGGINASNESDQHPKVLNAVLGTKIKLVTGYPGGNDITLAMERGEVQARCGWSWSSVKSSHSNWLKDGTLVVLIQNGLEKHEDMPNVPLIMDLAKGEEEQQMLRLVFGPQKMGRPFAAPPGIPADRLAALRKAFDAVMKDPALLAEAEKAQLEITPISGQEMESLVQAAYKTPPEIARRVGAMLK
jgi:tripartite-type tricarboxylate transporter receptor subunit TctC